MLIDSIKLVIWDLDDLFGRGQSVKGIFLSFRIMSRLSRIYWIEVS